MPPRTCSPACEIEKDQLTIELTRPCIPGPGIAEGLPPTYDHATEQPPNYVQAIAEEQPVSYENIMMAITTFQPEEIVRAWHTFRACQLSLLPKAASEHADRLLEMKIQLSRPEQQPRVLEGIAGQQLYLLERVVQTLEARTTSRIWALLQVATRADYDTHC
ncbi:hypothetical protein E4T50_13729 [Aureobasidium sp. EXF-12298]|nr:hypothetical protein E4T50_13729 [Aureobasidium sp. EXF-12298]